MSPSASNPNVMKMREHRTDKYNAKLIYEKWEKIQKDYFGNDAVTLIAITKFDDKQLSWSNNVEES